MNIFWIKIRSWHAISFHTRGFDTWKTVCGRFATGESFDERPGGEKTCESCLRIIAPK